MIKQTVQQTPSVLFTNLLY